MALTHAREKFAQHYAANQNLSGAYRYAYRVTPGTKSASIQNQARKLLNDPDIKARVEELVQAAAIEFSPDVPFARICNFLEQRIFADPAELTAVRVGCCRYCWGEDHKFQWREREFIQRCDEAERLSVPLPDFGGGFCFEAHREPNEDCPECGGEGQPRTHLAPTDGLSPQGRALFAGVKQTQHGIEVQTHDQLKALDLYCQIRGLKDGKLSVSGVLDVVSRQVTLPANDPAEAERIYREMATGRA